MTDWFLIAAFGLLIVQYAYWLFCLYHILKIPSSNTTPSINDAAPCSIIICARNEAENLNANLPLFLEQDKEIFEVIVVNDHSSDDTELVLRSFLIQYPHLRIIKPDGEKTGGKKNALLSGIMAAKYETILLSDADCKPSSLKWARIMTATMNDSHRMVAGYSPFIKSSARINAFARFENFLTAIQYFGFGNGGMPYMAVGRNIGYRKSLLEDIRYFTAHQHIIAGDDDLTVQQAVKHTHLSFTLHPDSFVTTNSPISLQLYIRQKLRHLSVSAHYSTTHQLVLGGFILTWALFYLSIIVSLAAGNIWLPCILLLFRWLILLPCYTIFSSVFKQHFTWVQLLVYDILFPFVWGIITIFSLFNGNKQWK